MAKTNFTTLNDNLNNIQALDDLPNAVGGLTSAQLKAAFDKAGNDIKTFLNDKLLAELASQTTDNSGASKIGIEEIIGIDGTTNVQDALKNIYDVAKTAQAGQILAGTIDTEKLADKAVKTAKLDDAAVDTTQLADGAVTGAKTDFSAGLTIAGDLTAQSVGELILKFGVTYGTAADRELATPTAGRIFFVEL